MICACFRVPPGGKRHGRKFRTRGFWIGKSKRSRAPWRTRSRARSRGIALRIEPAFFPCAAAVRRFGAAQAWNASTKLGMNGDNLSWRRVSVRPERRRRRPKNLSRRPRQFTDYPQGREFIMTGRRRRYRTARSPGRDRWYRLRDRRRIGWLLPREIGSPECNRGASRCCARAAFARAPTR